MIVTLDDVFSLVPRIVGSPPDPRWSRGSKHAAGPDGISTERFLKEGSVEERADDVLLRMGSGCFGPMRATLVPKDPTHRDRSKRFRALYIADRIDQAGQYALHDAVVPVINGTLSDVAIGFRPGVSMIEAIKTCLRNVRSGGYLWAAATDVENCFGCLGHGHLGRRVDRLVQDGLISIEVARLLEACWKIAVNRNGRIIEATVGVLQGSVMAPLLCNLLLDPVDRNVLKRAGGGIIIVRFADDILILARTREELQRAQAILKEEIQRLGLRIKAGTGHLQDLRDATNPVRWLGFAFSQKVVAPDMKKIVKKAASFGERLQSGVLDRPSFELRLGGIHRHYVEILSWQDADEVVRFLRENLIAASPFPNPADLSPTATCQWVRTLIRSLNLGTRSIASDDIGGSASHDLLASDGTRIGGHSQVRDDDIFMPIPNGPLEVGVDSLPGVKAMPIQPSSLACDSSTRGDGREAVTSVGNDHSLVRVRSVPPDADSLPTKQRDSAVVQPVT